jgi:carboxyl-terminal processing protease
MTPRPADPDSTGDHSRPADRFPSDPGAPDAFAADDPPADAMGFDLDDPGSPTPADRPDRSFDGPPAGPAVGGRRRGSRLGMSFAATVVAVLAGGALFVSGFTLGQQRGLTPGTSADRQAQFQPFWDAYNKITSEYVGDYDQHKLVEGAIGGLFQALGDPYSAYMSSEDFRKSLSGISGQFEGIGAEMTSRDADGKAGCTPLSDTCRLVVAGLVGKAPAEKTGVVVGDIVLAVDDVSVTGLKVDDVVAKVRGAKGTTVKLTLQRAGAAAPLELSIVRDVINRQDVTSKLLANGTVGYIHIDGFSSSAAGDFKDQLKDLVEVSKVKKLILDLRKDPGGFVDAARTIASQFVGSGPIYWEEYANGSRTATNAEPGGIAVDPSIQLVVLVDGGSASASEIVAGALKDTHRGTLVGEKTFGKGTIQQWQELGDYGGFRLSTAKWLTPDQTWIHGKGIEPDIAVAVPADNPPDKDPALDKALEVLATGTAGADPALPALRRAA